MRTLSPLFALLVCAACGDSGTYVIVTVEQGSFPSGVEINGLQAMIELDDGRVGRADPSPPNGNAFLLPDTLSFELRSGDGMATVSVVATGQGTSIEGSSELLVTSGMRNDVRVTLGTTTMLPTDGGVDVPNITITPPFHDFGVRLLGSATNKTYQVQNTGGPSAALGTVTFSTAIPGMNVTNNACMGMSLPRNGTCMVDITLAPTAQTPTTSGTSGLFATASIEPYTTQGATVVAGARAPDGAHFSLSRSLITGLAMGSTADVTVTNEDTGGLTIDVSFTISPGFDLVDGAPTPACIPPASPPTASLVPGASCNLRVQRTAASGEGFLEVTESATAAIAKVRLN